METTIFTSGVLWGMAIMCVLFFIYLLLNRSPW